MLCRCCAGPIAGPAAGVCALDQKAEAEFAIAFAVLLGIMSSYQPQYRCWCVTCVFWIVYVGQGGLLLCIQEGATQLHTAHCTANGTQGCTAAMQCCTSIKSSPDPRCQFLSVCLVAALSSHTSIRQHIACRRAAQVNKRSRQQASLAAAAAAAPAAAMLAARSSAATGERLKRERRGERAAAAQRGGRRGQQREEKCEAAAMPGARCGAAIAAAAAAKTSRRLPGSS